MKRIIFACFWLGFAAVASAQQVIPTPAGSFVSIVIPASAVNGGGVVTVPLKLPDGSASAPSLTFASETALGFHRFATNLLGFDQGGGSRMVFGVNVLLSSSGSFAWDSGGSAFIGPNTADLILSRDAANTLALKNSTNLQTFRVYDASGTAFSALTGIGLTTGAGTTAAAPLVLTHGSLLTSATADAVENDGTAFYNTMNATDGRMFDDGWTYFRLTGSGTGITTIADFFGATGSGIPMVANGIYEIEWHAYFSQATAGIATWTVVTATTALASVTGEYNCSNIAGIAAVGAPQTAAINATASSSTAFPVTGTEATGVTHYCTIRVMAQAGNGASNTRIRLAMSAGTATPLINSYFRVRHLPGANTGAFVS